MNRSDLFHSSLDPSKWGQKEVHLQGLPGGRGLGKHHGPRRLVLRLLVRPGDWELRVRGWGRGLLKACQASINDNITRCCVLILSDLVLN